MEGNAVCGILYICQRYIKETVISAINTISLLPRSSAPGNVILLVVIDLLCPLRVGLEYLNLKREIRTQTGSVIGLSYTDSIGGSREGYLNLVFAKTVSLNHRGIWLIREHIIVPWIIGSGYAEDVI